MTGPGPATIELLPEPEAKRISATGSVASIQEAEVSMPAVLLTRLWQPESLERLASGYWRYLTRASLGLFRVVYGEGSPTVVLGLPWLGLLRFRAPEYETSAGSAAVTWRIERGLLVAASGRGSGWLRIEINRDVAGSTRRRPEGGERARVRIRVEVRNFYPWLRGSGRFARFGAWLYSQTQLRIHRRFTVGFLRSLASLELAPHAAAGVAPEEQAEIS
jgi:hypothetical protein